MAKQPSPDKRLVYLHCASIFSGTNALVRKKKRISQLLETHKGSIKILTEEYTVSAIAIIAKQLLDEKIFESLPRAKLRYPELFQQSETQEAERAASEAEVIRIEAETAQDIVLTSDDEGRDECLDFEKGQLEAEPKEVLKVKEEAPPDEVQISAVEPWQVLSRDQYSRSDGYIANLIDSTQSTPQAHQALSFPRLHPVYLPFKTQHIVLVLVQTLLEECCLDFGNTWVPDLMEMRKWHEVESIELTEWTKRFLRYAKSLPPSAMKRIAGRSIAEVLFGTSIIRHSAVHRLPTSAAGILNMLSAATAFAEALNDSKRAERIGEIKIQLEASVKEIVQHQNLLERKLTDQLEDIARRRAELDELERSSIEEMLVTDKKQRTEAGSAFESFLAGPQHVSNSCACAYTPTSDGPKADSEAGDHSETSGTRHEQAFPDEKIKAQPYHQGPLGEEEPYHGTYDMSWVRPQKGDIPGERHNTAEEPILREDLCVVALEEPPLLDDYVSAEPVFKEDPSEEEFMDPDTIVIREAPQVELIMEYFDDVQEHPMNQQDRLDELAPEPDEPPPAPDELAPEPDEPPPEPAEPTPEPAEPTPEPAEPTPEPDINPMHSGQAEDAELLPPPSKAALPDPEPNNFNFHPPPPSAPSSTAPSTLDAAAAPEPEPEPEPADSHTITLKMLLPGGKVLRSVVFIRSCTRTAILNEARAYCAQRDDRSLGRTLLPVADGCDLALLSLEMYGYDMDLSTYRAENLSSLVRTVEKTGIPSFTLRVGP